MKPLLKSLTHSLRDLLPIVLVVGFFQLLVLRQGVPNLIDMALGTLLVVVGLSLFVRGLELGLFPLGDALANAFAQRGSLGLLLLFAFALGFGTTVAEPALIAVANEAAQVAAKAGVIAPTPAALANYAGGLRYTVALAVGLAILIGVLRIVRGWPIQYLIVAGYLGVILMTLFAPPEIVGIAYDSGGVTTSTITVPLVTALGVGLASSIRGRNPMVDGFGLIALASLTPMIFVMAYGILGVHTGTAQSEQPIGQLLLGYLEQLQLLWGELLGPLSQGLEPLLNPLTQGLRDLPGIAGQLAQTLQSTIKDLVPIALVLVGFQRLILRRPIPHPHRVFSGFAYLLFGLALFLQGLGLALFPLGRLMATQLTDPGFIVGTPTPIDALPPHWSSYAWAYLFAFAIGFGTTIAEPSLLAVAIKAHQVSGGAIGVRGLRITVALGVAVGVTLGAFRIVSGTPLHWYITAGYALVIVQTLFAPRSIVALAYDSGGVTTSTVTVPLVTALGLGLASTVPGRNPALDGFGLIAFASLFPIMAVIAYAQLSEWVARRRPN